MRRASIPPTLRLAEASVSTRRVLSTLPHSQMISTPPNTMPSLPSQQSAPGSPQSTPSPFRTTTPVPSASPNAYTHLAAQPPTPTRKGSTSYQNLAFKAFQPQAAAGPLEKVSQKHRTPSQVTKQLARSDDLVVDKGAHAKHRANINARYTALGELLEGVGAYSTEFAKYYSIDELDHTDTINGLVHDARIGEEGRKGEADPWLVSLLAVQTSMDDCDRAVTYLRRTLERVSRA